MHASTQYTVIDVLQMYRWGAALPGRPPGPGGAPNGMAPPRAGVDRFLLPLADADFALDSLIEDLQVLKNFCRVAKYDILNVPENWLYFSKVH